MTIVIGDRPGCAKTNPGPLLKILWHLPIAEPLRCVSIFKLHVDQSTFFKTVDLFLKNSINCSRIAMDFSETSGRLDCNSYIDLRST